MNSFLSIIEDSDENDAIEYLTKAKWNVDSAVNTFFDNPPKKKDK